MRVTMEAIDDQPNLFFGCLGSENASHQRHMKGTSKVEC
jgi:hypothetical protein